MSAHRRVLLPLALATLAALTHAQSGVLDQDSPFNAPSGPLQGAYFNGDATSLTWQAQVRAGLSGTLEGFTLQLNANNASSTVRVALRMGGGWNTSPTLIDTTLSVPGAGVHDVFLDVTSLGIAVTPGTLFVIEMQGLGTGMGLHGTYAPPPNPPAYAEPLFLGGPGCFVDCGWRIGFKTYVVQGGGTPFCFGDGTGTPCPCGPPSAPGAGCLNSFGTGGRLVSSGGSSVANDTLVLTASGLPTSSSTLFFQGTAQLNAGLGAVFGDGLRCAGGTVIRLGTELASGGVATYPGVGDPSVSVRGLIPPGGGLRHYQAWYRNAAVFCTSSTFNLSNGLSVTWAP